MPELRQNYFTKEWVIIATERAKRPEELVSRRVPKTAPQHVTKLHRKCCASQPKVMERGRCE